MGVYLAALTDKLYQIPIQRKTIFRGFCSEGEPSNLIPHLARQTRHFLVWMSSTPTGCTAQVTSCFSLVCLNKHVRQGAILPPMADAESAWESTLKPCCTSSTEISSADGRSNLRGFCRDGKHVIEKYFIPSLLEASSPFSWSAFPSHPVIAQSLQTTSRSSQRRHIWRCPQHIFQKPCPVARSILHIFDMKNVFRTSFGVGKHDYPPCTLSSTHNNCCGAGGILPSHVKRWLAQGRARHVQARTSLAAQAGFWKLTLLA